MRRTRASCRSWCPSCAELEPAAGRLYGALMRQAHYLVTTVHPWDQDPAVKLLTDSQSKEHWIRPNTSTLVGLAVLRRWGPYDPQVVGVSRDVLLHDDNCPDDAVPGGDPLYR